MRNAYSFILPFLFVLGCSSDTANRVHPLDVKAFEQKLENTPDKVVLDVRTAEEYRNGHFANATLIDIRSADFNEQISQLDRSKPVFVYCASGIRSKKAVAILNDLGFREVYELKGGFNEWAGAGMPFVKE